MALMMVAKPSFLVINVSRIGDTLFATPALRAIASAFPGCHITALGHPRRAEVMTGLPFVNQVHKISKTIAPWRGWLGARWYDYALVYGADEPLVSYALRVAKRVVAFRQTNDTLNRRLYRCVEPPSFQSKHAVHYCLELTAALDIPPAGLRVAYRVLPHETTAAHARLTSDIPAGATPLIGLQVASFPTKAYRDWPVESFAELADRIRLEWPHAHFLIYGGKGEADRTDWLAQRLGARATVYAGRLSLRQTAAIMSLTDLYVGVDTGPTHIMSAFDIPLVGLYHCLSSSQHTGPLDHPCFYALDHPRVGRDCTERTSMEAISVDTVLVAVRRALTERRTAFA